MIIYTGDYYKCKEDLDKEGYKFLEVWRNALSTIIDRTEPLLPNIILDRPGALCSENYLYQIGKALCKVPNIKVFTHNSIFILSVRVSIKNRIILPEDVHIMYYPKEDEKLEVKIGIDESIKDWPDGFDSAINEAFRELFGF